VAAKSNSAQLSTCPIGIVIKLSPTLAKQLWPAWPELNSPQSHWKPSISDFHIQLWPAWFKQGLQARIHFIAPLLTPLNQPVDESA
jgi:hypothetical protein